MSRRSIALIGFATITGAYSALLGIDALLHEYTSREPTVQGWMFKESRVLSRYVPFTGYDEFIYLDDATAGKQISYARTTRRGGISIDDGAFPDTCDGVVDMVAISIDGTRMLLSESDLLQEPAFALETQRIFDEMYEQFGPRMRKEYRVDPTCVQHPNT